MDGRALLSKIRLEKAQPDSIGKLRDWYVELQKKTADQALARYRNSNVNCTTTADSVYLTAEMRSLRQHHSAALRALLTAEQSARFDSNAAALAKKEPKGRPD
jgi:hypothetical protein